MRLALILALLCASAAQAGSRVEWEGHDGGPPFTFDLSPGAGGEHVATLTVTNNITPGFTTPSSATLELDGLRVGVIVSHGDGDTPDAIRLALPDGLFAMPFELILEEGETGEFRIVNQLPMG